MAHREISIIIFKFSNVRETPLQAKTIYQKLYPFFSREKSIIQLILVIHCYDCYIRKFIQLKFHVFFNNNQRLFKDFENENSISIFDKEISDDKAWTNDKFN